MHLRALAGDTGDLLNPAGAVRGVSRGQTPARDFTKLPAITKNRGRLEKYRASKARYVSGPKSGELTARSPKKMAEISRGGHGYTAKGTPIPATRKLAPHGDRAA